MAYVIPRAKLEIGMKIFNWTVLSIPEKRLGRSLCRCECGTEKEIILHSLLNGNQKQCRGCANRQTHSVHGESGRIGGKQRSRLFHTWRNMLYRCSPAGAKRCPGYHDCGIRVCDEWAVDYRAFRDWALANGYQDDLSIDRWPDQKGNYEPGNCRWATWDQQLANRRTTVLVTAFGETKQLSAWVRDERCRVSESALRERISKGWEPETAISTPPTPRVDRWLFAKKGRPA